MVIKPSFFLSGIVTLQDLTYKSFNKKLVDMIPVSSSQYAVFDVPYPDGDRGPAVTVALS